MKLNLKPLFAPLIALGLAWASPGLWADAAAGQPPAQNILVITGTSTLVDFTRFIQQNGNMWGWCAGTDGNSDGWIDAIFGVHTVTVQTTVPGSLAGYTQVWDLRFDQFNCTTVAGCGTNAITAGQQTQYLNYIAAGGSLFLMGDNGGYPGRNDGIRAIAAAVDSTGTFAPAGVLTNNDASHQGAYINAAGALAAEGFATDYRNMTGGNNWVAAQYNGIVANWGSGYKVLEDFATGQAVAVAWDCANLGATYKAGKLMVAFDWQMMGGGQQVGFCPPAVLSGTTSGANQFFWENSIDFLVPGSVCTTPTPTPTRTATRTATPTFTASNSATRTATPTPTLSFTPTATSSATRSATPTFSFSPSNTATATSSATRSATPTFSFSATQTATLSNSPTRTATPTIPPTGSATHTPTSSATATSSATRTATPTFTFSFTQSATPTYSFTRSSTPTLLPTGSATHTPTATPTSTASSTATSSATLSSTPTASATRSATPTVTATSTVTTPYTPTATATFSASPTQSFTFTATRTATESATLTASPTQSDTYTATRTATESATPSASPTATDSFTDTATRTASPTATATRTASPTVTQSFTFTESPTASFTPIPAPYLVTVRVYNSAGELVKELYGGAMEKDPAGFTVDQVIFLPGPASQTPPLVLGFPGRLMDGSQGLTWDGANNDGQYIGPGSYYIKVESKDPFGKVSAYTESIQIAPKPASRKLSIFNAAGELVWQVELSADYASPTLSDDPYAPEYDPSTGVATKALSIKMRDASGATYTETWDGRNLQGMMVESGIYTMLLTETRLGGQTNLEMKTFQVLRTSTLKGIDSAGFDNNPAAKGSPLLLHYTPVMGRGLAADLYTLAGERVASFADFSATGKISFGTDGLAPGIYMVVLREGLDKRVLKAAILN